MLGRKSVLRQSSSFGVAVVKQHGIEFSIVRFEEIDNGAFVNFICRISKDGKTWELQKRYSEFRFFYQAVAEYTSKVATNFPSKSVGRLSPEGCEKRRQILQMWFNEFLDTVPMTPGISNQVNAFLKVHENMNVNGTQSRRIDISARIRPGQLLKAGYLEKLGGNKSGATGNWKKRYCVLQDDLKYYESEQLFANGGNPKGIIKLNAYFVTTAEEPNSHFEFTIHAMPYALTCRAESLVELNSWINTLSSLPDIE